MNSLLCLFLRPEILVLLKFILLLIAVPCCSSTLALLDSIGGVGVRTSGVKSFGSTRVFCMFNRLFSV